MAVTTSLIASLNLGRVNYLILMGLVPLAGGVMSRWNGFKKAQGTSGLGSIQGREWFGLGLLIVLISLVTWLGLPIVNPNGQMISVNDDLGYFAITAHALPDSRVASIWSATLGGWCREAGETADVWYHWGPIWQVTGLAQVTGLPEFTILLRTLAPALNVVLVLLAGRFVKLATGWGMGWCFLGGAVSLVAIPLPLMTAPGLAINWLPGEMVPHIHPSLAYQFSYKFEAVLVLAALSEWVGKRMWSAIMILFLAGVSAPHTVAVAGLVGGVLAAVGILRKERLLMRMAVVIIGVALFSWGAVHFGFGVDMPKMADSGFIDLSPKILTQNVLLGIRGIILGLLLALPMFPGLWFWINRGRNDPAKSLGWLAISALAGSYLAFHILLPEGDRAHFTMYAHAILVFPIGIWGLLGIIARVEGWKQSVYLWLLIIVSGVGLYDLWGSNKMYSTLPLHSREVGQLKILLGDTLWGYFSKNERNWWIPKEATLAAILDSRCLRLNEIPKVDRESDAARFYGSGRIYDLVSREAGETEAHWSLRLATKLGIRHLVETDALRLPDGVRAVSREVMRTEKVRVYEFQQR